MAFDNIDPAEAHRRQQNGWTYVDVRTPEEFQQGAPQGALNIPIFLMGPMGMQPNPAFLDNVRQTLSVDQALLIGCRSGPRSTRACQLLQSEGFRTLANVEGGFLGAKREDGQAIAGWLSLGLPTQSGA